MMNFRPFKIPNVRSSWQFLVHQPSAGGSPSFGESSLEIFGSQKHVDDHVLVIYHHHQHLVAWQMESLGRSVLICYDNVYWYIGMTVYWYDSDILVYYICWYAYGI